MKKKGKTMAARRKNDENLHCFLATATEDAFNSSDTHTINDVSGESERHHFRSS